MSGHRQNVLVVLPEHADLALHALQHPEIDVDAADKEDQILAALTGQHFDLAVVGGNVGKRGPLILCEAVRVRQDVPVLVLVGEETSHDALVEHQRRQLDDVRYIDVRGKLGDARQWTNVGSQLRTAALDILHVPEDPAAAQQWLRSFRTVQRPPQVQTQPPPAAPPPLRNDAGATPPPVPPPPVEMPAPAIDNLTQDDYEFAVRIAGRLANIDWRRPPVSPPEPQDVAERTAHRLREHIRELERQLARLSFVYQARRGQFDDAAQSIANLEADKTRLEAELQQNRAQGSEQNESLSQLQRERTDLETRLNNALEENQRLTSQLGAQQQNQQQHERGVAGMLGQAQQAFNALRDQSAQALAQLESQVRERGKQLEGSQRRIEKLEAELQSNTEQARVQLEENGRLVTERAELTSRLAALEAELKVHQEQLQLERQRVADTADQLTAAQTELQSMREAREAAEQQSQQTFAATEQAWLDKVEKLKQSATVFRDAYQEQEQALQQRATEMAQLSAQLEERGHEIERLQDSHKALARTLSDEQNKAFEARLASIEEDHDRATQRIETQLGLLDELKEALADNTALLRGFADASERHQQVLAEVVTARPKTLWQWLLDLWQWLLEKRQRWIGAAVGAGVLLIAIIVLATAGGKSTTVGPDAEPPIPTAPIGGIAAMKAVAPRAVAKASRSAKADANEPPLAGPTPSKAAHAAESAAKAAAGVGTKGAKSTKGSVDPGVARAAAKSAKKSVAKAAPPKAKPKPSVDRKTLRKEMFAAYYKKSWSKAAALGVTLRDAYHLDWEAQFKLGEAQRHAGQLDAARATYEAFAKKYPTNAYAGDANYWIGEILLGKKQATQAKSYLERVAADKHSHYARQAKDLLRTIK